MPKTAKKKTASAKVALGLAKQTPAQLTQTGHALARGLTGNAHVPNPPIAPAALDAGATDLERRAQDVAAKKQAYELARAGLEDAATVYRTDLQSTGSHIDVVARGDASIIASTGAPVKGAPVRTTTPPIAPDPLSARPGLSALLIMLKWAKALGARSYLIQWTTNPTDEASWTGNATSTKTTATVKLPATGRWWLRVIAVGAHGQSPPTDPATSPTG